MISDETKPKQVRIQRLGPASFLGPVAAPPPPARGAALTLIRKHSILRRHDRRTYPFWGEFHVPSEACITELSTPDNSTRQGAPFMRIAAPHPPAPLPRLVAPRSGKNRLCLIPTPVGAQASRRLARIDGLVRLSASGD